MSTTATALTVLMLALGCGDKDADDTGHTGHTDGGSVTDGGSADGGTADGGTTDGGAADGGTTDGGTAEAGSCIECHGSEAMLQDNVEDTGEAAHEEPSGEG